MQNNLNRQKFINALNQMKQLPRTEWLDFAQKKYQEMNDNSYDQRLNQAKQMIINKDPYIQQFANQMGQYGIKF